MPNGSFRDPGTIFRTHGIEPSEYVSVRSGTGQGMDEFFDLFSELDSPEATRLGDLGFSLWPFEYCELLNWLIRKN